MAALSSLRTASASCVRPRLSARAAVPRPAFSQARRSTGPVRAQQDFEQQVGRVVSATYALNVIGHEASAMCTFLSQRATASRLVQLMRQWEGMVRLMSNLPVLQAAPALASDNGAQALGGQAEADVLSGYDAVHTELQGLLHELEVLLLEQLQQSPALADEASAIQRVLKAILLQQTAAAGAADEEEAKACKETVDYIINMLYPAQKSQQELEEGWLLLEDAMQQQHLAAEETLLVLQACLPPPRAATPPSDMKKPFDKPSAAVIGQAGKLHVFDDLVPLSDAKVAPKWAKPTMLEQQVMFATDRDRMTNGHGFGVIQAPPEEELKYGTAKVSLPLDRNRGQEHSCNHRYQIVLTSTQEQEPLEGGTQLDAWLVNVRKAVEHSKHKELVIYVHGYNNSFSDAIRGAAQLVVDTDEDQGTSSMQPYGPRAALAFDWASCHSLLGYAADIDCAKDAGPKLAQLLCNLGTALPANSKVHIVCHSLGNYVLHEALANVARTKAAAQLFSLTKSVIFAAPDIFRSDMVAVLEELRAAAGNKDRQLVLYCNSNDRALWASTQLRARARAGYYSFKGWCTRLRGDWEHSQHPFMVDLESGMKTVDVSVFWEPFSLNHGYFKSNKAVLDDIAAVFAGNEHGGSCRAQVHHLACKECLKDITSNIRQLFEIQKRRQTT